MYAIVACSLVAIVGADGVRAYQLASSIKRIVSPLITPSTWNQQPYTYTTYRRGVTIIVAAALPDGININRRRPSTTRRHALYQSSEPTPYRQPTCLSTIHRRTANHQSSTRQCKLCTHYLTPATRPPAPKVVVPYLVRTGSVPFGDTETGTGQARPGSQTRTAPTCTVGVGSGSGPSAPPARARGPGPREPPARPCFHVQDRTSA